MADLLCALPLISALLVRCGPPVPLATGYVEGDYVQAAPLVTARVTQVGVRRRDVVRAGQMLARMDATDAEGTGRGRGAAKAGAIWGAEPAFLTPCSASSAVATAGRARCERDNGF